MYVSRAMDCLAEYISRPGTTYTFDGVGVRYKNATISLIDVPDYKH